MSVRRLPSTVLLALALAATPAMAGKTYDPGASDTEIRVGNLVPYTGPFAQYGAIGRAEAAYFRMVNQHGGINGRKVAFVSLDCGPMLETPVELAHRLVEQERVLLFVSTWGSSVNRLIRPYLNQQGIPQLFVSANDEEFNDPSHFPWTMGFAPSKHAEAARYAQYVLANRPNARIAVLYSDDEEGAEYRAGVRAGLGSRAEAMIVKEAAFRYADPSGIDPLVAEFKRAGADVFMNLAVGRYATHGIRAAYDQGWRPLQFVPNASLSIAAFLEPAGLEKAAGLICNARSKGWGPAEARRDPAVHEFVAWLRQYLPEESERDAQTVFGYEVAQTLEQVLKGCGDELTRANVMARAAHLDLGLDMLRPGIRIRTSPADYRPIKDFYLVRFEGQNWVPLEATPGAKVR
jgi:ABC-type branched-subunit amino acid transport system substrate-binding protein